MRTENDFSHHGTVYGDHVVLAVCHFRTWITFDCVQNNSLFASWMPDQFGIGQRNIPPTPAVNMAIRRMLIRRQKLAKTLMLTILWLIMVATPMNIVTSSSFTVKPVMVLWLQCLVSTSFVVSSVSLFEPVLICTQYC